MRHRSNIVMQDVSMSAIFHLASLPHDHHLHLLYNPTRCRPALSDPVSPSAAAGWTRTPCMTSPSADLHVLTSRSLRQLLPAGPGAMKHVRQAAGPAAASRPVDLSSPRTPRAVRLVSTGASVRSRTYSATPTRRPTAAERGARCVRETEGVMRMRGVIFVLQAGRADCSKGMGGGDWSVCGDFRGAESAQGLEELNC